MRLPLGDKLCRWRVALNCRGFPPNIIVEKANDAASYGIGPERREMPRLTYGTSPLRGRSVAGTSVGQS